MSVEQLERALEQYFLADSKTLSAGQMFVGAARVGPAFGLPADDSPHFIALLDRLANPAIRAPLTIETVDSIYDYILRFRQLPPFGYSRKDRRSFKRLNGILFKRRFFIYSFIDRLTHHAPLRKPSDAYTRYFQFAQRVAAAKDKYNEAKAAHEDILRLVEFQKEVDSLEKRWRSVGGKDKIEHAMAEYGNLTAKNPASIWNKLESQYSGAVTTVGSYRLPKTELDPKVLNWSDDAGWEHLNMTTNAGSVLVRIKRIQIRRPWLEEQVFGVLSWQWMRSAPLGQGHVVADGKGLATVMDRSKTISLMPRQLVIATFASDNKGWPGSGFLAGYLASIVPATPKP